MNDLTEERIEFALNNQLEDPSDEEASAFHAGARWAASVIAAAPAVRDADQAKYDGTTRESGARYQADAHLRALLRYTEGFYGDAIKHGMKAGPTANAIAHVERAGKALHQLVHAWADVAEARTQADQAIEREAPTTCDKCGTPSACAKLGCADAALAIEREALPPMPKAIGLLRCRRLYPAGTAEFWGLFNEGHGDEKDEAIFTAEQMRAYVLADRALRASQADPCAASGWKPIESAPQGVKVLAGYWNRAGKWRTVTARYYLPQTLELYDDREDPEGDGYAPEGWYEECETQDDIKPIEEPPILWQYLPAAPVSAAGDVPGEKQ